MKEVVWVEDMITLPNLTEETLLNNIRMRYEDDLIYVSNMHPARA